MIQLAHGFELHNPQVIALLITIGGPALFAFRCWLHERQHQDHHR